MTKTPNRTCIVCGEEYHYCNNCDHNEPAWKNCWCSEECKKLFNACNDFDSGHITKYQLLNEIKDLDITGKTFTAGITTILERVNDSKTDEIEQVK